jgi:hypothetical protein|tara:strand:- start:198 stop:491 length:294 start_codon:yes stop_codon:yes gene_type:complete
MLIESSYKDGDVVSLKLSSGEEIVARLDKETPKEYTLKKPMVLIMQAEGLGLAPYMYSVKPTSKFNILVNSVSCIAKTETDIADQYTATTSGIQLEP